MTYHQMLDAADRRRARMTDEFTKALRCRRTLLALPADDVGHDGSRRRCRGPHTVDPPRPRRDQRRVDPRPRRGSRAHAGAEPVDHAPCRRRHQVVGGPGRSPVLRGRQRRTRRARIAVLRPQRERDARGLGPGAPQPGRRVERADRRQRRGPRRQPVGGHRARRAPGVGRLRRGQDVAGRTCAACRSAC